tara:strand:+ start:154 stop:330 length:177 start_codon:yes stop_codon:yes gene_type:complete
MSDGSSDSYYTAEESDDEFEDFYKIISSGGYVWILSKDVWCSYDTWELVDDILEANIK